MDHAHPAAAPLAAWHRWIVHHDDSPAFLVLYIGLAVVLSIWISLFWLVAVVAAHLALELVRQAHRQATPGAAVAEALWELKLDAALVLFALALALYMEVALGVAGVQGAARLASASRVAARFAGWQRAIRGALLSLDDAVQVLRALALRRGRATLAVAPPQPQATPATAPPVAPPQATPAAAPEQGGSWRGRYPAGARVALALGAVCAGLLLAAPWLTHHSAATALATLAEELRPFP
jgi:hypothetical protein